MTFAGKTIDILPTGGINNGLDAVNIGDKQTPDCRNVRFRENSVQKRDGFSRFVSDAIAAANVTGIFELAKDDGSLDVVAFAGTSAVRKDGSAWSSIKGAMTVTSDKFWRAAVLANVLVATNDNDQIVKYVGGANNLVALGGSPPSKARDVVMFHNYLLLLNTEESAIRRRARVRWSDLNAPETWPAANFNDLLNQGGQFGVGFGGIGDQMYAFLNGSIWQISYTGDDVTPFTFVIAHPSVGAISRHAIVAVDGRIFFAGNRGIYVFDGGTPRYIGQPVEGFWRTINKARLANVVGVVNERDNEVRFSFSTGSGTTNDTTICFDYVRETWAVDDGYQPTFWAVLPETLPLQPVFGTAAGRVQQINTGLFSDDGTAITAYCKTKPLDFGDPGRKRKVRKLVAVVDTSSVSDATVTFRVGYDLAVPAGDATAGVAVGGAVFDVAIFDTDVFAQEGQKIIFSRPMGHGHFFQGEFRNAQLSVPMTVSRLHALVKGDADE